MKHFIDRKREKVVAKVCVLTMFQYISILALFDANSRYEVCMKYVTSSPENSKLQILLNNISRNTPTNKDFDKDALRAFNRVTKRRPASRS